MDCHEHMIWVKGTIKTVEIANIKRLSDGKFDIMYPNGKTYTYKALDVLWLQNPIRLNIKSFEIYSRGKILYDITSIYEFSSVDENYLYVDFKNGSSRYYNTNDLIIKKSCLGNVDASNVFEYFKEMSDVVSVKLQDGTKILYKQYENINFVDEDSVLACYLNPQNYVARSYDEQVAIFPFGCNQSQYKATKLALENQISVIEGPPGTGKTQTILNIIANLVLQDKTMQIVSNNNPAISNIWEKLEKYDLDFFVAFLGNSDNREKFFSSQNGVYPDFLQWTCSYGNDKEFFVKIKKLTNRLNRIYQIQEQLANTKQELDALHLEMEHFSIHQDTYKISADINMEKPISAQRLMDFWLECIEHKSQTDNFKLFFKLKCYIWLGIKNWQLLGCSITEIVPIVQELYYKTKEKELESAISDMENQLEICNAQKMEKQLQRLSLGYFKSYLIKKYSKFSERQIFDKKTLDRYLDEFFAEYPVVLSTTHSACSSVSKKAKFDYVIMDEASQVDVVTGALSISNAKNAVIVGDSRQLSNIVKGDVAKVNNDIFAKYDLDERYHFAINSFLTSIMKTIPQVKNTLLREHYRCQPQIINYCNQKFYNNQLVIMTTDNGRQDTLNLVKTVVGEHERGHINKRQIEVVKDEILPNLQFAKESIGIIAPYKAQVASMIAEFNLPEIEIETVHKFQGREKDAIIITTVDDKITDFPDNPELLNVAISRAKNYLTLVVSGNEQDSNRNITDFMDYIVYHNPKVQQSKINSIFDFLYSQYTTARIEFLKKHKKISEQDSENLMYGLIQDILQEEDFRDLKVVVHLPLNTLIPDSGARLKKIIKDENMFKNLFGYAMHPKTHIDFLIYNKISKKPVLAIEVDGYYYHQEGSVQGNRDEMKNTILDIYKIPWLRCLTNHSREKEKITVKLTNYKKHDNRSENMLDMAEEFATE